MYLSEKDSARRLREAENARRNRQEIASALTLGQVTRRDLMRWGIFTAGGMLALKNGLSPFASSAYAASIPTGAPPSPTFGAVKFSQRMPRPEIMKPIPMVPMSDGSYAFGTTGEPPARKFSYHEQFTQSGGTQAINPVTWRGPMEGRPPGEFFAHQRWDEIPPKVGYLLSLGQIRSGSRFHARMPFQDKNSVWSFGPRAPGARGSILGSQFGRATPQLMRMRYDEPVLCRIYNDLPDNPAQNNGFGRNEISTHYHNAHNGAESDGACNAYHMPGTFYDYHWSAMLARRDMPSVRDFGAPRWQDRASTCRDDGTFARVEGDFREIQGSMWFHDHRFFYTAENVQKGNYAVANMYSGPDNGNESTSDGISLRLPSGKERSWGNVDFDVNLVITNPAVDRDGQLTWDIFDTDGYLGDMLFVNGAFYPYFEVMPRRYRFRILNASMARFIRNVLVVEKALNFGAGTKVPVHVIANDGNLLVKPILLTDLDTQGVAERFDIIVDFSRFRPGDKLRMVNVMKHKEGRGPDRVLPLRDALRGDKDDPAVGPFLEFRVVDRVASVDSTSPKIYTLADRDESTDFSAPEWRASGASVLTTQIPIVAPVRTRTVEFKREESASSRDPVTGQCIPECGDFEFFPWVIRINGEEVHPLNANRISALIPKPGEIEHWELVNGGGGWDHPVHLHFEEAVTIDRAGDPIAATERLARKDVWRLGQSGKRTVRIQVRFGEFGGAYVMHCHNTTHEDFAMLMRYQLLTPPPGDPEFKGQPHWVPTETPIITRDGVTFVTPEILPEGDPRNPRFARNGG